MFDANFYADLERELTAEEIAIALEGPFDDGSHQEVEAYQEERDTYYAEVQRDIDYGYVR